MQEPNTAHAADLPLPRIIADSREKDPLTFAHLESVRGTLHTGDYSIQNSGMTLEMEVMVSQVMERGATVLSCLCDNNGNGYPMGVKITTEEAGLYFGGVEEITTAEDLVDENGNYIDYEGNIVDEDHAVKLKITRPHGVSMNIAVDRWVHLAFVVQPVTNGYGLGMLFINGVLSRANRYTGSLRQNTPVGITIDSDKADVRIRGLRYYRTPLGADEVLGNWIIDRPTAALIQSAHTNNAVGDTNNTTDSDGNIAIDHDTLLSRGRGILTIIRSDDSGYGLSDLFTCTDKKQNFKADLVKWEPPLDANGNPIGEGFEVRNVRVRIQGTSSVKYPYKNFRIYLTTQQGSVARVFVIGGVDVTATADGYAMRGSGNSVEQAVICAKTDFVDSSLVMNTGGAHLFNDIMHALNLDTPPQAYDARVRQAIDGLPCDIYAGTNENGTLTYSNAGHNPPFLIRDELVMLDSSDGTPLGLFPDEEYSDVVIPVQEGDSVFLYTDGVNEAVNPSMEFYGTRRLENVLRETARLPKRHFIEAIEESLTEFCGDAEQSDDITMLSILIRERKVLELNYDIRILLYP